MVIVSIILGTVFVLLLSYGTIKYIEKSRSITFAMPKVIGTGIVTLIATVVIGILYAENLQIYDAALRYVFLAFLSAIAITDWQEHFIPNKLLGIMVLVWAGITALEVITATEAGLALLFSSLIGAIVGGLMFLLCYLLSKRQMGAGDVKLAFVMGLYLTGNLIVGAVFYGVILCAVFSVAALLRKKIGLKDGVPLAPFLYMGTLITYIIMA